MNHVFTFPFRRAKGFSGSLGIFMEGDQDGWYLSGTKYQKKRGSSFI
jgi:hypothetical protein